MRLLILSFLIALACIVQAQTVYDAASIPKELLAYAGAVVREDNMQIEVKDLNNTVLHCKKVITILNSSGENESGLTVFYNKLYRIKSLKGVVYNAFGQPVSKISENNFQDYSAADNAALFEDIRVKQYRPGLFDFPCTVEYDYELQLKQSLNFPEWQPAGVGVAVQNSTYSFSCPAAFDIRYKEFNCPAPVKITSGTNGQKVYTWTVNNLKALRNEPYSKEREANEPEVDIASNQFTYDGHSGSYTNWTGLGRWTYDDLLKSRLELSPETASYIRHLTDTIANPKRKAKAIYEYMQGKTRYVSVQVGIGGYQPFAATEVDRLGYGDCKALVNYTQALLKAANINSYYCVVYAGSYKKSIIPDFASMQGNHIILCLPFKNDTTWLECTSQKIPFGYLGDFTDDRWVLACTPDGGKLMHTPKYTAEQSRQIRIAKLDLKESGEISGTMSTTFEGSQYENRPGEASDNDKDLKMIKDYYPINNLEIKNLSFKQSKDVQPVNKEMLTFQAKDYGVLSGGRLLFPVNAVNRVRSVPHEVRNRTASLYINRGYTDVDEIIYTLPVGYKLEVSPLNVNVSKPFGKFKASVMMNADHQLVYKRSLEIIDGTYSKDEYQEFVDFYQSVYDADHYNAALIKGN